MGINLINPYDIESHIAEIYDQIETQHDDIDLIRGLIGEVGQLRILEPFCGTGRILIPLAEAGHTVVGMDNARSMLDRAKGKISLLPQSVQKKIDLQAVDVLKANWPSGFDLVILGGNCFYELAAPEEQEKCIQNAALSLVPGGYVYIDNDHMEGELSEDWKASGGIQLAMTGVCMDGTTVEGTREIVWVDTDRRLVRFRRWTKVVLPDGSCVEKEYFQQKHPVSAAEIRHWLEKHGFIIGQHYGDHNRSPYIETSQRAIFWAWKSDPTNT